MRDEHEYAAAFPFGDPGCDALPDARGDASGRASRSCNARPRRNPGLFSRLVSPGPSWFEPPESGPGPVTNRSRGPQQPGGATGSQASPPTNEGVSNYDQLVGDCDTLVIDTVGINPDRKYAMVDLFGTPYTKSLHVLERYRLRDYDDVNRRMGISCRHSNCLQYGYNLQLG